MEEWIDANICNDFAFLNLPLSILGAGKIGASFLLNY